MTTLVEVRDGLEATLKTIDGLRVYDYIPDDAHYPAALIDITDIEYTSLALNGTRRAVFAIYLLVPRTIDRKQLELYEFIDNGPRSIMAAVFANKTLGVPGVTANVLSGSVMLDTNQMGLTHLYGRTVSVNAFVS